MTSIIEHIRQLAEQGTTVRNIAYILGVRNGTVSDIMRFEGISPPIRKRHTTCTTDGCDRPHHAKGLCQRCYDKAYRQHPVHAYVKEKRYAD